MKVESQVYDLIRRRLKLPPENESLNETIEMYMDEVKQRVLNYTKQPAVPAGLKYTWVNMVIDLFKVRDFALPEVTELIGEGATTIKIGDTSVQLAAAASVSVDAIVTGYAADLRRYRKMGWQG